jgi:prophage antirepressor-like protein
MSEADDMHTANVRLIPFLFESDTMVRITDRNGNPWYLATDVCQPVGIKNVSDAVGKLDSDEKGIVLTDSLSGQQKHLIVSESGMHALVLRSRDAMKAGTKAHRFRKWVTDELIPQVRRTGSYQMPGASPVKPQQFIPDKDAELSMERKESLVNTACRIGGSQAGAELWLHYKMPPMPSIRYAATRARQIALFEIMPHGREDLR